MMKAMGVGGIGNYYGGLSITIINGKFYWGIGNYDGYSFEEIPDYLFNALMKYENERIKDKQ